MTANYVVSAHKPTSVRHALKGNFTSPEETNLILSKGTRFEILTIAVDGLKPVAEYPIYGRIAHMELYRPPGRTTDLLFFSTERYQFCTLSYDAVTGTVVTEGQGDIADSHGRPVELGQLGVLDPGMRCIGLHLYEGKFQVLPIELMASGKTRSSATLMTRKRHGKEPSRACRIGDIKDSYHVRLEDHRILSMVFLHNTSKPTIVILHQDAKDNRVLKSYTVDFHEKALVPVANSFDQVSVDDGANLLIAVPPPYGGVIVLGERSITYCTGASDGRPVVLNYEDGLESSNLSMLAYCRIDDDGSRYLLSDHNGILYVLVLESSRPGKVKSMQMKMLGETSLASAIVYLDNRYVYVGSHYGDSMLIRIREDEEEETEDFFDIIERYTNLAPIVDFCVVDIERQGQGQMVTCSGGFKDGSLRIIRNGVGITEQAVVEMSGIKGIWSLKPSSNSEHHDTLVISFIGETRVLVLGSTGEMQEVEEAGSGFCCTKMTLEAGNVCQSNLVYQITESSVRLINPSSPPERQLVNEWKPSLGGDHAKINVASANALQAVVALGGGILVHLEFQSDKIVEVGRIQMEHEIACLNVNPLGSGSYASPYCAVGLWTDISVNILALPTLEHLSKEFLEGEIIPRSILLASFEDTPYLLAASGDGHLYNFLLDDKTGNLSERKKITLGTQPVVLTPFESNGVGHVFASCDRPTVIYSSSRKLLYSNVNLKETGYMCPFNSSSFPNSLAVTTDEGLIVGTIDEIQKLHIRTVPLGEMPRRICHQESSGSFGVLCMDRKMAIATSDDSSSFKVIDNQTYDVVETFTLDAFETGHSIASVRMENESGDFFAVGTCYAEPSQEEPQRGRILLFEVTENKQMRVVARAEVPGAVYSLAPFNGMLLAAINNKVCIYQLAMNEEGNRELSLQCSYAGNILIIDLIPRGDFIVVGDLMRSVSLLLYKPMDHSLEEIARDPHSNWTTSLEALDDDTYLASEHEFNLYTVKRNSDAATDEERRRLRTVGHYHLGELVNRFRHGSLVMSMPETEHVAKPSLLYGTVNGAVGVIAQVSEEKYQFLSRVQERLSSVVKGVGHLDHSEWRRFVADQRSEPAENFLDGDLIETLLDLKPEDAEQVARLVGCTVEALNRVVEDLSRIH